MLNIPSPAVRCKVCNKKKRSVPLRHKCHCRCGYNQCRNHNADIAEYFILKYCNGCKARKYCSKRCQKKDWTRGDHRNNCNNNSNQNL